MNDDLLIIVLLCLLYLVFYQHIDYYIGRTDPLISKLHYKLSDIHPKLKQISVYEGRKTYTVNKKDVFLCVRDENGDYYDKNMLVYALCHEYAHVLNDEWDTDKNHSQKFWRIFDKLLIKAHRMGMYDPTKKPIENYCGHD